MAWLSKMLKTLPKLVDAVVDIGTKTHVSRNMSTKLSPNAQFDKCLVQKYLNLPVHGTTTMADYIWMDGSGSNLRCRTRTLNMRPNCVEELPEWSIDGSKTNHNVSTEDSDIRLLPVAMYNDPMRRGGAKLILCETFNQDYEPMKTNTRSACCNAFSDCKSHSPLFGFCQQYMLCQYDGTPLGWPQGPAELPSSSMHYCGVSALNSIGREVVEAHARACLYAGVAFGGFHSEQLQSKWKYEIEPIAGIKGPDDIIISRYLLSRIAGEFGIEASIHPKFDSKKSGCGMHVKFTTQFMSENNGIEEIIKAAEALSCKHNEHMKVYDPKKGKYNKRRLGEGFKKFTWSCGGRKVSVRIPTAVAKNGCGYLEDYRPASNCDPYAVCTAILRTTLCESN